MPLVNRSKWNYFIIQFLMESSDGLVCCFDLPAVGRGTASWAFQALRAGGLIEPAPTPGGFDRKVKFYRLTDLGRDWATAWGIVPIVRDECCEDALLGIEGDHAPYCPFVGATPASSR